MGRRGGWESAAGRFFGGKSAGRGGENLNCGWVMIKIWVRGVRLAMMEGTLMFPSNFVRLTELLLREARENRVGWFVALVCSRVNRLALNCGESGWFSTRDRGGSLQVMRQPFSDAVSRPALGPRWACVEGFGKKPASSRNVLPGSACPGRGLSRGSVPPVPISLVSARASYNEPFVPA